MKARSVKGADLPDGGFLLLDGIRMVRINYDNHMFHVDVVKDDGKTLRVATWYAGSAPMRFAWHRPETDEEKERHARSLDIYHRLHAHAREQAQAWASELRWILENR